jgi:hypothetical protein
VQADFLYLESLAISTILAIAITDDLILEVGFPRCSRDKKACA